MRISDWSSDVCSSDLLAVTLLAAGPLAQAAGTSGTPDLLARHIDLGAHMNPDGTTTPFDPGVSCLNVSLAGAKLFDTPPPEEHGWKALANLLQSLTPSVNTDIPLTPSQIKARISALLDNGQNQQDLAHIEKRLTQEQARSEEHTSELQSLMRNSYAVFS